MSRVDVQIVHRPYDDDQDGFADDEQRTGRLVVEAAKAFEGQLKSDGVDVFARKNNVIAAENGVYVAYRSEELAPAGD